MIFQNMIFTARSNSAMKESKSCYFWLLVGVMTIDQQRKCILAAEKNLHLQNKNSQPELLPWEIFPFLWSGLPKPRYAWFWQLSDLRKWKISRRKCNFGFEFFYFRGSLFQFLGTVIFWFMETDSTNNWFQRLPIL